MSDIAEWAPAGAKVTQDHESGCPLAEALPDIGAGRFFAYSMKFLFPQNALDLVKLLAVGGAHPDPGGLPQ